MKKLFLTLGLVAAGTLAYGQGTIYLQNSVSTPVKIVPTGGAAANVPTTAGLMNYGVFYGTSSSSLSLSPILGVNSTTSTGIILAGSGSSTAYQIPGSVGAGDVYWLQIKGWTASFGSDWQTASTTQGAYFGQTDIRQVTLAGPAGPGTQIWQSASGTSANKFYAMTLNQVNVPEPSTMALAGLGAAALLIFRRRK
jgi:hypothetical protein